MESTVLSINCSYNTALTLKTHYGHFATNHSHINYYMDMTTLKVRHTDASNIARAMANEYVSTTVVDTIICMDGTEIIGAYLAQELTSAGIMSMNSHTSIYIITPEYNSNGQLIFRDNIQPMVKDKHVLLLLASSTTGKTIAKSLECIEYYGGIINGISAIFSAQKTICGHYIHSIFSKKDLPDYINSPPKECPLCKQGKKIDAIVNSYGYSKLWAKIKLSFRNKCKIGFHGIYFHESLFFIDIKLSNIMS